MDSTLTQCCAAHASTRTRRAWIPPCCAHSVGAGAYVFTRYIMTKSVDDPQVRGMLSISPVVRSATWREWSYSKMARAQLALSPAGQIPTMVVNQNLAGFFGPKTLETHLDLVDEFSKHLTTTLNPQNYAAFLKSWTARPDLWKELTAKPIAVPLLAFYGGNSLRQDEIVEAVGSDGVFKSPRTTLVQMWKSADLVHQDCAGDVAEAFKLFCRGFSVML